MPACLEVCPTGSRHFGNVLDPDSDVSRILKTNRIFVLKEQANTLPRFFYYFDERYPRSQSGDEPLACHEQNQLIDLEAETASKHGEAMESGTRGDRTRGKLA